MFIKTTIYIKNSLFQSLCTFASSYSITTSELINMLLIKTLDNHHFQLKLKKTIQYQDRIDNTIDYWRTHHVSIRSDLFDKCQDLKNVCRMSLSLFIAIAFDKYLVEITNDYKDGKTSDNYPIIYLHFITKNGYYNHITTLWSMPDEKTLIKIMETHTNTT